MKAENPQPAYRKPDPGTKLDEIFCFKQKRLIGRDHTISLDNKKYLVKNPMKYPIAHQFVEIREYTDESWIPFYNEKPIKLELIKKNSQS